MALSLWLNHRQRWLVVGMALVLLFVAAIAGVRQIKLAHAAAPLESPADAPLRAPEPPSKQMAVHVTGAVQRPGVYQLAAGARVSEAVQAAGGALPEARIDTLNLAARLNDADKVFVPTATDLVQAEAGHPPPAAWGATRSAPLLAAGGLRVDINGADKAELLRLPGMTATVAGRVVKYRQKNGRFEKLEDLRRVPGLDEETFRKLQPHAFVP